jgi:hypothetical protein
MNADAMNADKIRSSPLVARGRLICRSLWPGNRLDVPKSRRTPESVGRRRAPKGLTDTTGTMAGARAVATRGSARHS